MAKANAPRIPGRLLCLQEIRYDLGDQRRVRLDRCKSTGSTGLNPGRLPYCDLTAVKHVWVRGGKSLAAALPPGSKIAYYSMVSFIFGIRCQIVTI